MVLQLEMATPLHVTVNLDALVARIGGDVILPHDPRYDTARKVQNFTVDRRPLAIVRAANARDVAETVRFARAHDLPLAVRSGGHSVAKHSMIDDGLVIDLRGMNAIAIDPETRV